MDNVYTHQPVLLPELIEGLVIRKSGYYIDATFGRGGHSKAILDCIDVAGRLLAIDKDPAAVDFARTHFAHDARFRIQQGSFAELEKFTMAENCLGNVDGILLDLGVSSPQLDDPERGFSFMRDGPLDMRMDTTQGLTVAEWLTTTNETTLANILFEYGEERFSRRIAKAILTEQKNSPIITTLRLAEIIKKANPAWERDKHPATRSFQALRIFINQELMELPLVLEQCLTVLKTGGRMAIISFHSLEDRIVKQFIRSHEKGNELSRQLPIPDRQLNMRLRSVGRAIKPSAAEITRNPRSRSAVLRIAEKIK